MAEAKKLSEKEQLDIRRASGLKKVKFIKTLGVKLEGDEEVMHASTAGALASKGYVKIVGDAKVEIIESNAAQAPKDKVKIK